MAASALTALPGGRLCQPRAFSSERTRQMAPTRANGFSARPPDGAASPSQPRPAQACGGSGAVGGGSAVVASKAAAGPLAMWAPAVETPPPRTPDHPRSLGQAPADSWSAPSPRSLAPTGASEAMTASASSVPSCGSGPTPAPAPANLARACACGHVFAEDALYCQRCGLRRPEVGFRILCNGRSLKGPWTDGQADLGGSGSTTPRAPVAAPQGGADLASAQEMVLLLRETLFALCEQLRLVQRTNDLLEERCARYCLDLSRLSGPAAASEAPAPTAAEPVPGAAPSAAMGAGAAGEAPAPPQLASGGAASAWRGAPALPQLASGGTPSALQEAPQPAGGGASGAPREAPAPPQPASARASLPTQEAAPASQRAAQAVAKTSPKAVKAVKIHAECCSETSDGAVSKVSELFEPNSAEEVRTMIQQLRRSPQSCGCFGAAGEEEEEECASLDSSARISVSKPDGRSSETSQVASAADVRGRGKTVTRRIPLGLADGQALRRLTLFAGTRRASQATGVASSDQPAG
uniref:Uncharacterized protein n=1 Tax=Alexandrium monilatum TaxID=311494 RepID=A0A7S4VA45_9DINO